MRERIGFPTEGVNSELRGQVEDLMQTPSWKTERCLLGAGKVDFVKVERDLPEPEEAAEIRRLTWSEKLAERREVLEAANPNTPYIIRMDDVGNQATGESALFERLPNGEEKRKMWAGTTITLAQQGLIWKGQDVEIPIYPINYTEWIACYNPAYAEAFRKNGLTLPYAGIGVSILMETGDGFTPLTRRGIETPVYPGRLYSPGGGPKPGESSAEAVIQEIIEETGLVPGQHFEPSQLRWLALVSDAHFARSDHSRPELIACLSTSLKYREIEEIQYETAIKKGQKEADVWGLEAFSLYPPTFGQRLVYHGAEMCPPTEAGLAHAALDRSVRKNGMQTAINEMSDTINRLQLFRRSEYIPPIQRF